MTRVDLTSVPSVLLLDELRLLRDQPLHSVSVTEGLWVVFGGEAHTGAPGKIRETRAADVEPSE